MRLKHTDFPTFKEIEKILSTETNREIHPNKLEKHPLIVIR
jgi:hypothetical protein